MISLLLAVVLVGQVDANGQPNVEKQRVQLEKVREYPPSVGKMPDVPNVYIRYYTPSGTLVIEARKLNNVVRPPQMKVIEVIPDDLPPPIEPAPAQPQAAPPIIINQQPPQPIWRWWPYWRTW